MSISDRNIGDRKISNPIFLSPIFLSKRRETTMPQNQRPFLPPWLLDANTAACAEAPAGVVAPRQPHASDRVFLHCAGLIFLGERVGLIEGFGIVLAIGTAVALSRETKRP